MPSDQIVENRAESNGQLPPPPIPAEVDMGGNPWFPFHHQRLLKSRWWKRASYTAKACNVQMWCNAYTEVPAGSLPDDNDELAEAAGFGPKELDDFVPLKAEIMSCWILCSDRRWYHPTMCEVVMEAWERLSDKRRAEREKKAAQRARVRSGLPAKPDVPGDKGNVPRDNPEKQGDTPTQTGEDKKRKKRTSAPKGAVAEAAPLDEVEQAFAYYNAMAGRCDLALAKKLDDRRRDKIRVKLRDGGPDQWKRCVDAIERSAWLRGLNDRKWKADLDFMFQNVSWTRLCEGFYRADYEEKANGQSRGSGAAPGGWQDERSADLGILHDAALEAIDRRPG